MPMISNPDPVLVPRVLPGAAGFCVSLPACMPALPLETLAPEDKMHHFDYQDFVIVYRHADPPRYTPKMFS